MKNNSKLFILSNIFAISFFGCKNDNKKSDMNNEGDSKQYLDLVINKSSSQKINTDISAISNFSIDVLMTCGTQIDGNLTDKILDNTKFTISSKNNKAQLPYEKDKACEYKFEKFTLDNIEYVVFNNNTFLILKLKNDIINLTKSHYKKDSQNILVSGSKLSGDNTVKLTISDTIKNLINGQNIDTDGNIVLQSDANISNELELFDNVLTINKLKAPDPLKIKVVKNSYTKSKDSKSEIDINSLTTYSIMPIDNYVMPSNNCFIFSLDNTLVDSTWEKINELYNNSLSKIACSSLYLNIKNNWNDYAGKINYIISANTADGYDNAYRVVTIGKMKY